MNLSILPTALHLQTRRAEAAAIEWGWDYGLIEDELYLKNSKTLWFAGYALPCLEPAQLDLVTRFFFCLHTLDDMLEECVYEEAMEFFYRWEEYLFYQEFDSPFSLVWCALDHALETIAVLSDEIWLDTLWFYLDDYLQAKRWEFCNKKEGIIPGMNLYVMQRSYGSGIYLATHFLKLNFPAEEYPVEWVEQRIARILCLSTDLSAFEFHRKTQSIQNELVLLQIHTGISDAQVCRHAAGLISLLFDSLLEIIDELKNENKSLAEWADHLLLLLGGCLYWSEENALRYGTTINGMSKT